MKPIPLEKCIGLKFNKLTVLKYFTKRNKDGILRHHFLCECDCGRTKTTRAHDVRAGRLKSCNCLRGLALYDQDVGSKFNLLTVLKHIKKKNNQGNMRSDFECLCECGNKKIIVASNVKSGRSKSCGCYAREVTSQTNIKTLNDRNKKKSEKFLAKYLGKRYGKLVITGYILGNNGTKRKNQKHNRFICSCDCGNTKSIVSQSIRNGKTISCGCHMREMISKNRTKHGHARTGNKHPAYLTWLSMRQRCKNPKTDAYKWYGGRGIKVCKRWDSFENFLEDVGERPSTKHSIDRINNDGDYTPNNTKWSTSKEQNENRRGRRDRKGRYATDQQQTSYNQTTGQQQGLN